MTRHHRLLFGLVVLAAVLASFALPTGIALLAPSADGSALDGSPAPAFRLRGPAGPVALDDLRGRAVVLSFLYTSCPDSCPITAATVGRAIGSLPAEDRDRVAYLAITVDPARDTPERIAEYTAAQGLTGILTMLTGDRDLVAATWAAYDISVERIGDAPTGYTVRHRAVTYVIDPAGRRQRLFRDETIQSDRLAAALRRILS